MAMAMPLSLKAINWSSEAQSFRGCAKWDNQLNDWNATINFDNLLTRETSVGKCPIQLRVNSDGGNFRLFRLSEGGPKYCLYVRKNIERERVICYPAK